jgi:hypothetical protein
MAQITRTPEFRKFIQYQNDMGFSQKCKFTLEAFKVIFDETAEACVQKFGIIYYTDKISPCFMVHTWLEDADGEIIETSAEVAALCRKYVVSYITDKKIIFDTLKSQFVLFCKFVKAKSEADNIENLVFGFCLYKQGKTVMIM